MRRPRPTVRAEPFDKLKTGVARAAGGVEAQPGAISHCWQKRGRVLRFPHVFMPAHAVDPAVVDLGVVADR